MTTTEKPRTRKPCPHCGEPVVALGLCSALYSRKSRRQRDAARRGVDIPLDEALIGWLAAQPVAERVRLLLGSGWPSEAEIARASGVSQNTLSRVLNGQRFVSRRTWVALMGLQVDHEASQQDPHITKLSEISKSYSP